MTSKNRHNNQPPRANTFMGQHFLVSQKVLDDIVAAADLKKTDTVLEVGPGKGILTEALGKQVKKVVAVEKDPRLVEYLQKLLADQKNIEIVSGDILKLPRRRLALRDQKYKIVANLPYYITSRFLRLFLEKPPRPSSMTLMVQLEVARRIIARPPHMNLLALSVQSYAPPHLAARQPRGVFRPRPRVDSALIKIDKIGDGFFRKNGIRPEDFFSLAKRAFSQKRKMLRHSIGINSKKRPEELGRDEWMEVAKEKFS